MLNTFTVSPPGSIIAPVLFCLHGEIERDYITVDLTYGPSLNLTCSPQNHFCRLYQPTVCRHRLAAEPSYMLTRCAGWNIDICEHSKLYLELSPTGCITTVGTTVVVLYLLRLMHICIVSQNCKSTSHGPDPGPDLLCSGPNLGLTRVRPGPDSNLTASLNKDLPSYPCQALPARRRLRHQGQLTTLRNRGAQLSN